MKPYNMDLREDLAKCGVTQVAIAAHMGITPVYLSRVINKPMKAEMKDRIQKAISELSDIYRPRPATMMKFSECIPHTVWMEWWGCPEANGTVEMSHHLSEVIVIDDLCDAKSRAITGKEVRFVKWFTEHAEDWEQGVEDYNVKTIYGWRIWDKKPTEQEMNSEEWTMPIGG